jgi:dCMP deaminase
MNISEQELKEGHYFYHAYPEEWMKKSQWNYKELTWIETFCRIAKEISTHSNCRRLKVGAVIVRNNRIISIGYNGTPVGMVNCSEHFTEEQANDPGFRDVHKHFSELNEVHAEMNAILYAQKEESNVIGCDLFITTEPCMNCTKLIVTSGIKNVYYIDKYDRGGGSKLLEDCNIPCVNVRDIKFNDKPILTVD